MFGLVYTLLITGLICFIHVSFVEASPSFVMAELRRRPVRRRRSLMAKPYHTFGSWYGLVRKQHWCMNLLLTRVYLSNGIVPMGHYCIIVPR